MEMEWKKVSTIGGNSNINGGNRNCGGRGGEVLMMVGIAMTEEQLETLRHQISIYASICEQLVEMHKNITAHQDTIAGIRLGSIYGDPLMMSGGVAKITARQRWSPTPMQLTILENIFDQGNGTPSKPKIKEMASDLSQHGQISETNVYNWFQNRRARSKRKQSASAAANAASSTESEGEAENECSKEVKGKLEKTDSFQSPGESSTIRSVDAETKRTPGGAYSSNDSLKSLEDTDIMLNPRMNQSPEKIEMPEGLGSFRHGDSYNMFG